VDPRLKATIPIQPRNCYLRRPKIRRNIKKSQIFPVTATGYPRSFLWQNTLIIVPFFLVSFWLWEPAIERATQVGRRASAEIQYSFRLIFEMTTFYFQQLYSSRCKSKDQVRFALQITPPCLHFTCYVHEKWANFPKSVSPILNCLCNCICHCEPFILRLLYFKSIKKISSTIIQNFILSNYLFKLDLRAIQFPVVIHIAIAR